MLYDAIVIGAGPAGSTFSYLMAKNKFRVLILDRSNNISRKVCGEYLCPEGVKIINDLKLNDVLDKFKPLTGMIIHSPKGKTLDTNFPISNGHLNYGVSVNRKVFDNRLLQKAKDCGTQVELGETVVDLHFNGSFWHIKTASSKSYYSRLLIGADGRNSFVARHLNLNVENSKKSIALHAWLQTSQELPRKGQMFIFKGGSYIGVDPINEKEVNISLVCNAEQIKKHNNAKETFYFYLNQIKEKIGVVITENDKVHTSFPIENNVRNIIGRNVALIGDASGFIDPITGEGIFNAIKTASLLFDSLQESPSLVKYDTALRKYKHKKDQYFKEKSFLNKGFQWLIRRDFLLELVASFLNQSQKKKDAFIGIIGNIYTPLRGVFKILF